MRTVMFDEARDSTIVELIRSVIKKTQTFFPCDKSDLNGLLNTKINEHYSDAEIQKKLIVIRQAKKELKKKGKSILSKEKLELFEENLMWVEAQFMGLHKYLLSCCMV